MALESTFLYLMTEGFSPTVIDSQVLDTLRAAKRAGVTFDLVAFVSPRDWWNNRKRYQKKAEQVRRQLGCKVSLRVAPKIRSRRIRDALARILFYEYRKSANLVIHARNHMAADIGLRIRKWMSGVKVIVDVRGDVGAEYRMRARQGSHHEKVQCELQVAVLQHVLGLSSRIFAVSHALKAVLREHYKAPADLIRVFPCLADETRFSWNPVLREEVRKREGLEEKRVVVFPGSTGRWHHIPATLDFLSSWMAQDPLLHFVALCPDTEAMRQECGERLPDGRFTVLHAEHDQVAGWLNAADLGILLRADDPVNRVASPTKFAEYALTGLPVAMSAGIGDYSELVLSEQAGFHVNDSRIEHSVERAAAFMALWKHADRARWASSALHQLSKGSRLEDLIAEYQTLKVS